MSEASRAVFLSYASQDVEVAKRICEELRAGGVEVWFDQSELVGGDAWDAKIRRQIAECALFVPVISAHTQARLEGYFRIEWKLAAQRTHAMAEEKTFLLPVVIDATRDVDAKVPTEFKSIQWTRLPGGEAPEEFCRRLQNLLGGKGSHVVAGVADPGPASARPATTKPRSLAMPIGVALASGVALATALYVSKRTAPPAAELANVSPPAAVADDK